MTLSPTLTLPPLENGDRLTRSEFERRYATMPHVKKAELIEGTVYMASPLRAKSHGEPHERVMAWLGAYWAATPGVELLDNATVRLDRNNEPQPDALLRLLDEADEVVVVDVTPETLQERLRAGKIYASAKINQALQNFFQRRNLLALRELALERLSLRIKGLKLWEMGSRGEKGFASTL